MANAMIAPTPSQRAENDAHIARLARLWPIERSASRAIRSRRGEPVEPPPPVGTPFDFYRQPGWKNIVLFVALQRGTTVAEILGTSRSKNIAGARHIAVYLVHQHFPHLSFPDVGRLFGGRDHTTILHSERVARRQIEAKCA